MQRSDFTSNFTILNHCQETFGQWHFERGMCFADSEKWWVPGKRRPTRHEGIDFCCYRAQNQEIIWFDEKTKVPVLYDGHIGEIFDDFLGKSVLVRHFSENELQFCSIYAHIDPAQAIKIRHDVSAGQCIGRCSSGKTLPAHLHLSVLWLPASVKALDWQLLVKLPEYFTDPFIYI